ncbi:hypothetical protein ACFU6I_11845 [Streptomyces sp. NPDC057486]|uniref:hypothetical protein n=1 Tax=Streptomyces sp. NPDC057486 TaxID=3346145 RepID=UPI003688D8B3
MATVIGITVGKDTLLRLVRDLPAPHVGDVEVLGVDDFTLVQLNGHLYPHLIRLAHGESWGEQLSKAVDQ